jgi:hypothetical protein
VPFILVASRSETESFWWAGRWSIRVLDRV